MQPFHPIEELVQAGIVAAHSVVVVITSELGIQQLELFPHPAMAILLTPFG
jgi:predicted RNase H-like nuclease